MGGEGGEGCGQGQQEGVSQLAGRKGAREVSMAGDGELAPEKEGNGLYLETAMRKAKSKNTVYSNHQGLNRVSHQTKNTQICDEMLTSREYRRVRSAVVVRVVVPRAGVPGWGLCPGLRRQEGERVYGARISSSRVAGEDLWARSSELAVERCRRMSRAESRSFFLWVPCCCGDPGGVFRPRTLAR